ncbi:carbohydrate ABC transporter permease [Salinibacterium sp. PAMC 21357]|uniref:carbohydrate ABC transporter permease n=1 Tax=Salinibacterium sp. PAMC 21357 TaxID=1112215 RepID=UPI000287F0FB|nr:sugar ABC transporter permease [Salinibacterium sp. PAMC 21357]
MTKTLNDDGAPAERTLLAPSKKSRPPKKKAGRKSPMRVHPALWLFPMPAVILLVIFMAMPTLQAFHYAITDWNGYSATFNYVGVDNFVRAFTGDILFMNAVTNNVKYMLVVVIVQTIVSLVLSLMLVRNTRGGIVLRALFFFPTILSSVSVAFIWRFIYDPNFGLLNSFLGAIGLEQFQGAYLGDPAQAIYWVALVQIWAHSGQMMVVFVAGLQAIPAELYEAAELDGANRRQRFTTITWPLLAPATAIVVAYTTIQSFKAFDLILGIAGNPPKSSVDIISTRIYTTFANTDFGYAAAQSVIFMLLIVLITVLQRRVLRLTQKQE